MKNQPFKSGDRVAERPKSSIIPGLRKESQAIVNKYRSQRFGTVVDVFKKGNHTYVSVLWDGLKTPSTHAQMRLILEEKFPELMKDYCSALGG